ncbi:MAG: radical SAM protein [Candidatus Zhuqueibacterota bacterium]
MNYKYLFGPVPSRRLGISLGIDLIPYKTCSYDCVYCECGRTTHLTDRRAEYVPTREVVDELREFLGSHPKLDFITFSGSGEPTLHIGLGEIVQFIKVNYPQYKLALLTNGSLMGDPRVHQEILPVDIVLPSLDAVEGSAFKAINRPHFRIDLASIIQGLADFREIYKGAFHLEVFICPGVNDQPEHLHHLKEKIHFIKPDLVQLNSLDRPGTEDWVQPATRLQLEEIAAFLDWQTEIIAKVKDRRAIQSYHEDIESGILEMIRRRPCTLEDLSETLGLHINEINKYLETLLRNQRIASKKMERGTFFIVKDMTYDV